MKALVVYDSVFWHIRTKVAQAIGDSAGRATAPRGRDVKPEHLTALDALIVGSPDAGISNVESGDGISESGYPERGRSKASRWPPSTRAADVPEVNSWI
jgi:hypothetical protein